jgi:hypothetical protein
MRTQDYALLTVAGILCFFIGVVVTIVAMTWWMGKTGRDSCSMRDIHPDVKNRFLNDYFNNMMKVANVIESSTFVVLISENIIYYFVRNDLHLFILTIYQLAFVLSSIGLTGVFLTRRFGQDAIASVCEGEYWRLQRKYCIWLSDKSMHFMVASLVVVLVGLCLRLAIFLPKLSAFIDICQ